MKATAKVWTSSDNGQMACSKHKAVFGSIPWRAMTPAEQAEFRSDLADIIEPDDALCEVCRGEAHHAAKKQEA